MKSLKHIKLLLFIVLVIIISSSVFANEIKVKPDGKTSINVIESTYHNLKLENSIISINTFDVSTDQGIFTKLTIPGYAKNMAYGTPELPVKRKLIEIPAGANPKIKILSSNVKEYNLSELGISNKVFPVQPPQSKSVDIHEFIYNPQSYKINSFGDDELVNIDVLGYYRAVRIARLNIFPVKYNPVTNSLRVYSDIKIEITFENADIEKTIELKKKKSSIFFSAINHQLLNYQPLDTKDNFMRYPVKYVIISDRMFENQLQPLIEWKTQKGFTVIESYTDQPEVGNTTSEIKNYIQGLYDAGTPEDPSPSFILFVGDIQQIPAWDNGNGATDRNYCEYTGDLLPEIYYGRFSAQTTAHLQPQIDKTIQYEKYTMPDPSYLEEVVLVSGVDASHAHDWGNGQINYGTINYFNEDHNILSHTYLYPASGSSSSLIIQNISDGVTFGNYTAHCSPNGWADPSFTISDIPTLENENKYGLLIGNCCSSSEYQQSECFGEAIVRAENKGAVGYIGASNSTYWDEDYYFGVGVGVISENPPTYEETSLGNYDRSFHDHGEVFEEWYVSQDEVVHAGNMAVLEGSPGSAAYYWDVYNILGDPSLMIYYSVPSELSVNYEQLLPLNTPEFIVNTEPYAYVAISMNGILHGAGLADENGYIELEIIPFTTPGDADVIVTKQNAQPYIGTVLAASPDGPYLAFESYNINDESGNNNGLADFGETILLDVEIENLGNSDAINATATISTSDPYVTIIDNFQEWDVIPAQSSSTQTEAYEIIFDENVPDQHIITFILNIESNSKETWSSLFAITANAPEINFGQMIINDELGNNNGRLDPGETVFLEVANSNSGHCLALNAFANISTASQYIEVLSSTDSLGTIGFFGAKVASFEVTVDPETPIGVVLADFDYEVVSGSMLVDTTYRKKIGLLVEDFETGDFSKFDWQVGGDELWFVTNLYPYEGYFHTKSGAIDNNKSSELSLSLEIMTADSISFIRKVSSALGHNLKFYINNTLKDEWSGTTEGWAREAYYVGVGNYTFKWEYKKSGGSPAGADCAWLDYIIMPPIMTLTVYAGTDDNICIGDDYQCQGDATDWVSVFWTTSGTGTFDDNTILNAVYTPSTEDIENGSVELTITATDNDGETADDEMLLGFITEPEAPVIPEGPEYIDVYLITTSEYTGISVASANFYQWNINPVEAGIITGSELTGFVEWSSTYLGTAFISYKAINDCGEGEFSEQLEVTIDNTVNIEEKEKRPIINIFPNPNIGQFTLSVDTDKLLNVDIKIFNMMGNLVYQKNSININKRHLSTIDASKLSSGIYNLIIQNKNYSLNKKMIIQ